ncbi:hypothetical protein BDQ17DRAFT_1455805, partial [Cyathus striatus]
MYWALVVPELVLTWAVRQLLGARLILKDYEHFYPDWTMKHAHFLQMGGFHLRTGESTVILYPKQFHVFLQLKKISLPSITEADIEDRSKADALTKTIVVSQTIWFVVQCIGRRTQRLALTQLEVTTLAVISCTFILCVIWWDKPFDVQQPIYLDCTLDPSSRPISEEITVESNEGRSHVSTAKSDQVVPTTQEKTEGCVGKRGSDLTHSITSCICAHSEASNPTTHLKWSPYQFLKPIVTVIKKISFTMFSIYRTIHNAVVDTTHEYGLLLSFFEITIIAALFGLVHCIAWNYNFPSTMERDLWRISAVGVGVFLSLFALAGFIILFFRISDEFLTFLFAFIILPAYIVCRYFLLVEALISLRDLPSSALLTIEWSSFLPHV